MQIVYAILCQNLIEIYAISWYFVLYFMIFYASQLLY